MSQIAKFFRIFNGVSCQTDPWPAAEPAMRRVNRGRNRLSFSSSPRSLEEVEWLALHCVVPRTWRHELLEVFCYVEADIAFASENHDVMRQASFCPLPSRGLNESIAAKLLTLGACFLPFAQPGMATLRRANHQGLSVAVRGFESAESHLVIGVN